MAEIDERVRAHLAPPATDDAVEASSDADDVPLSID
jgi:hypothetical protein